MAPNKKKKQQRNAFFWFMQDLMPQLKREGMAINGVSDVVHIAFPRWERMSAAEREPFERIARHEKARSKGMPLDTTKRDNRGVLIVDKKDVVEEKLKVIDRETKESMSRWPAGDGIEAETFILVSFQYLCVNELKEHMPLEVGMVQFSMKDGVKKVLNEFINPGQIPLGFRYTCQSHSDDTHQIPIQGFKEATDDYLGLWVRLENFVNPNNEKDEYPPIYCLGAEMEMVVSCMDWLHLHAAVGYTNRLHRIYHMENMLVNLFARIGANVAVSSAIDTITTTRFDHTPGSWCRYHEEKEAKHCAMGVCKRYAFAILDALSSEDAYDYPLTPNHLPLISNIAGFVSYTPSAEPLAPRKNRSREPPRRNQKSSSSGPFSARDIRYQQQQPAASSQNAYHDDDVYDDDDDDTASVSTNASSFTVTTDASFRNPTPSAWGRGNIPPSLQAAENRFAGRTVPPPVEDLPKPQGWADNAPPMRNPTSMPRCLQRSNVPQDAPTPQEPKPMTLAEAARLRESADKRPSAFSSESNSAAQERRPMTLAEAASQRERADKHPSEFGFSVSQRVSPPSQEPKAMTLAEAARQRQEADSRFSGHLRGPSVAPPQGRPLGMGLGSVAPTGVLTQGVSYAATASATPSLGLGRGMGRGRGNPAVPVNNPESNAVPKRPPPGFGRGASLIPGMNSLHLKDN